MTALAPTPPAGRKKSGTAIDQDRVETVEGTLETPTRGAREIEGRVALADRFGAWVRRDGQRIGWRLILCDFVIKFVLLYGGLMGAGAALLYLAPTATAEHAFTFGVCVGLALLAAWSMFLSRALWGPRMTARGRSRR